MKKLLNTLYITTQGVVLHKEGQAISIQLDRKEQLKMPIHLLSGVVCFGNVTLTPFCMGLCVENGVIVSFLTDYGKFIARVSGRVSGNVLLRRAQYRCSEDLEVSSVIARRIVTAKAANCRTLLMRARRDYPHIHDMDEVELTIRSLGNVIRHLKKSLPLDSVRGKEGEAAQRYFSIFDHLIVSNKDFFKFTGRNRRPPTDAVNALLSFLYTLLVHDLNSACESVGLDPSVGFLHRDRPGRPSLALDLMEELRPVTADRVVLSLINRQQLKEEDFDFLESGAVTLTREAKKIVLKAWQERKRQEITHPYLKEKVEIGLLPYIQALLLARYLRRDIDDYPAYIWR